MPMQVISEPTVSTREQQHYVGIRVTTPFRGMFAVVSTLLKELRSWVKVQRLADQGPFLLRYHVIDMQGEMQIEVGFVVATPHAGDGRVQPGALPAGTYASLVYRGSDVDAIWTLLRWCEAHDVVWRTADTPQGQAFGCRYEAYLTDYRVEPRKKQWDVQLAIEVETAQ